MRYLFNESMDKSTMDKDHKKQTYVERRFKKLYLSNDEVFKYIAKDIELSSWMLRYNKEYLKNAYKGIFIIDKLNQVIAGYGLCIGKFITPIYVFKDYRGIGLGEEILKELIYKLNAKSLEVYEDNEVARHLYKKYGFKEVFKYLDGNEKTNLIFMTLNRGINNLNIKNDFDSVKDIVDSLTRKEFSYICKNKEFIDSPHILYRMTLCNNINDPICFVECYKFPMQEYAEVIYACKEKYREKGLMIYLLFLFTNIACYEKKSKGIIFKVDKDNKFSIELLKKLCYQYDSNNIFLNSEGQYEFKIKFREN